MAKICSKPSGSCQICQFYKFDNERNDKACFAKDEFQMMPSLADYKMAISTGNIQLAQKIYAIIFQKKESI